MSIITLTTDWQKSDHYVGVVKGKILSRDISAQLVDISHQITLFDIAEAAFVLDNCFRFYPKGTVHIIGVNAALNKKRALLLIENEGHFFITSDCGFPGLLFPEQEIDVYKIDIKNDADVFQSLEYYVDAADKLIKGTAINDIAKKTTDYIKQIPFLPVIDENEINSRVIYIDSFSNIITNVNKELFDRVGKKRSFKIYLQSNHYVIDKISESYLDSSPGDLLALFNSSGNLEVAINYGAAAELLSIERGASIRIQFLNENQNELKLSGN